MHQACRGRPVVKLLTIPFLCRMFNSSLFLLRFEEYLERSHPALFSVCFSLTVNSQTNFLGLAGWGWAGAREVLFSGSGVLGLPAEELCRWMTDGRTGGGASSLTM